MKQSQQWPSPAKLNLFLHITRRRDDGYHELQSVFQLIDFADVLYFSTSDKGRIELHCDKPSLAGPDNLVYRAANALRKKTGCDSGATIKLHKKLPVGAGLGGGSSNAATALVALNTLWQLGCSGSELEEIGLSLGADVPVFVRGITSWAEGIGEKLHPIDLPQRWFVVLNPAISISTAELFNDRQLTRDCSPITIRGFHDGAPTQNVFESLVCEYYPEVELALTTLRKVAASEVEDFQSDYLPTEPLQSEPRMTGTGSSVFLACQSEDMARKVLTGVYKQYERYRKNTTGTGDVKVGAVINGFVAKGVEQSPLRQKIL